MEAQGRKTGKERKRDKECGGNVAGTPVRWVRVRNSVS